MQDNAIPDQPVVEAPPTLSEAVKNSEFDVGMVEAEKHFQILVEVFRERDPMLLKKWFLALIESRSFWIDIGLIGLSMVVAFLISRMITSAIARGKLKGLSKRLDKLPNKRKFSPFRLTLVPVMWGMLLIANGFGFFCPFLRAWSLVISLFAIIQLPTKFIEWKSWMHIFTMSIFAIVALHVLGMLDDVAAILDHKSIELGSVSLSCLDLIKGFITFLTLFWLAGVISNLVSRRVKKVQDLNENIKVLTQKGVRLGLYIVASLLTLAVMGIPITALAVFGGALGLGIGFGLQKVVSNLVSGIILLMDKSIKPGDVIEIGGTYGWINALNLRYVSVITRDNKEHLIPNEDLITNPVINWSFSSKLVRIRAPFGISYGSDIRLAMQLAEEAVNASDRIVKVPAPRCNLMGFGDSSVDLELRFWIEDPTNGVGRVRSQVLLAIWDSFAENGIKFPFPQRDVHLRLEDRELVEKLVDLQKS
jgi:small-conductance mechanosensitive channel